MLSSAVLLAVQVVALASQVASQSSTSSAPAVATHVVTVANNLTATNGSAVFTPEVINATLGDSVIFTFKNGTHSATRSTFAEPCVPIHDTNSTVNGFDTGLRPANNGTSVTNFTLVMTPDIINETIWIYDQTTCGIGGVAAINIGNATATFQPFDAFVRNAVRLNGTGTASSSVASATGASATGGSSSGSSGSSSPSSGSNSSSSDTGAALAARVPVAALALLLPLFALATL